MEWCCTSHEHTRDITAERLRDGQGMYLMYLSQVGNANTKKKGLHAFKMYYMYMYSKIYVYVHYICMYVYIVLMS